MLSVCSILTHLHITWLRHVHPGYVVRQRVTHRVRRWAARPIRLTHPSWFCVHTASGTKTINARHSCRTHIRPCVQHTASKPTFDADVSRQSALCERFSPRLTHYVVTTHESIKVSLIAIDKALLCVGINQPLFAAPRGK